MQHLTNTQALITFIEVETGLLSLAHASQAGTRTVTTDRYVMDDAMGELADKFWSVASSDLAFTPTVDAVFNEVKQLGYALDDSGEWDYSRQVFSCEMYLAACESGMDEDEEIEFLPVCASMFNAEKVRADMDSMSKQAQAGCGCIYELYVRRLSADIDNYIAALPATQQPHALRLAKNEFDYQSADEINEQMMRDREQGLCSHGIEPDCCPCGCGDIDRRDYLEYIN
ncbi:hypothetical protein [Acinetobacter variabilis]|uniref:hypothetical protein n=1 Tax=Acinetobacter variabilis TaxID=70346 RepID=UPI0028AE1C18|nr:hypothetical protein [Acinetobacter variabilis]